MRALWDRFVGRGSFGRRGLLFGSGGWSQRAQTRRCCINEGWGFTMQIPGLVAFAWWFYYVLLVFFLAFVVLKQTDASDWHCLLRSKRIGIGLLMFCTIWLLFKAFVLLEWDNDGWLFYTGRTHSRRTTNCLNPLINGYKQELLSRLQAVLRKRRDSAAWTLMNEEAATQNHRLEICTQLQSSWTCWKITSWRKHRTQKLGYSGLLGCHTLSTSEIIAIHGLWTIGSFLLPRGLRRKSISKKLTPFWRISHVRNS